MKLLLKNNISTLLILYIIVLLLLNVLPINAKDSALNNNYTLHIRWDYLGHFLVYGGLGVLGIMYAKAKRLNALLMAVGLLFFAVIAEIFQQIIPYRAYNLNDLVANTFGVLLGIVTIFILLLLNRKYRLI